MESKPKILHSERLLLVHGCGEELTIVYGALIMKVNRLEDVLEIRWGDVRVLESLLHLVQIQQARVMLVQGPKGFTQTLEIDYIFC